MARKYKVIVSMSGTRNGQDWPRPGQTIELPDSEAADYIAAGIIADPNAAKEETATAPASEKAVKRGRGSARAAVDADS